MHDTCLLRVLIATNEIGFPVSFINDLSYMNVMVQVLKQVRKEILKDCKIAFSRVFPMKFQAAHHHLWKMAEQLGATCSVEVDSSVTHVVSTDSGTEKSRWAVQNGKFLVHPKWLEASNYLWIRQLEEQFPVKQTKSK